MIENGGISRKEFDQRVEKCLAKMKKDNIDLMCVYGDAAHPENLIYLTNYSPICADMPGYGGYNALFLLTRDGKATLVIDRDWQLDFARTDSWVEDIRAGKESDIIGEMTDFMKKEKLDLGKIEMDTTFMLASFYKKIKKAFGRADIDEESRIVAGLRETKSGKEIELITKGLEILSKAHDVALEAAGEGITEIDIAQEIRHTILNHGAEYTTALFVDGGLRSTIALASPMASPYRLKKGDMVLVSIFCVYKNYSAGMDRAWVVGKPSDRQQLLAEIELKTLEKSLSLVKAGVATSDFMEPVYYGYAEPMLKEAGIMDYNIQGYVGHGTGVKIFESPVLSSLNPTVLKPGMVIDMEPGIYSKDPKIGGMRTSEFILVTETGYEILYEYPRRTGSWVSAV